jgi:hypothetical protein
MAQKFANAARGLLASGINNSTTTIEIASGGALFPVANGTDWFNAVLQDETGIEIVRVNTHTSGSNTFTVVRGQEGTTARSFALGSVFGQRVTAGDMEAAVAGGVTLDGTETLTNKTLVDPILTLGAGQGTAGQVPVSQGAGLAPVWGAVAGVISDYQEFTSSGTWTKPAGATWVYVEAIGGGGGGAARASTTAAGGGGGGGGFVNKIIRASDAAATETITIGAGGAGGAAGDNNNGADGGASSFGSLVTAPGGKGAAITLGGFGGGGEASTTSVGIPVGGGYSSGAGGGSSTSTTTSKGGNCLMGGAGGASYSGATGGPGTSVYGGNGGTSTAGEGGNGAAPGGGGGGGMNPFAGGDGGAGRVRVWAW